MFQDLHRNYPRAAVWTMWFSRDCLPPYTIWPGCVPCSVQLLAPIGIKPKACCVPWSSNYLIIVFSVLICAILGLHNCIDILLDIFFSERKVSLAVHMCLWSLQDSLRTFIPMLIRTVENRENVDFGVEARKPVWWPAYTPFAPLRCDVRDEAARSRVSGIALHKLRGVLIVLHMAKSPEAVCRILSQCGRS